MAPVVNALPIIDSLGYKFNRRNRMRTQYKAGKREYHSCRFLERSQLVATCSHSRIDARSGTIYMRLYTYTQE